jgi:hypothetical protein
MLQGVSIQQFNKFFNQEDDCLKLLSLIDAFQEMFLADTINLQEALQIAILSPESQADFFNEHCIKWKKDKHFKIHNLNLYVVKTNWCHCLYYIVTKTIA